LSGIQAYAGHLSHETDNEKRKALADEVVKTVKSLRDKLEENGIKVEKVSGISTGTLFDKADAKVYNEAQVGSYIFSDASYNKLPLKFENALFVLTSVVSIKPDRIVTDSGVKTCGVDQGLPEVQGLEDYAIELHEEHGIISKKNHNFKLNDRLRYIPGHCCSTVNLYDKIYLVSGDDVVDIIPVVSRGKSQ
jgi:3-hydroxy-D-aspartate aldolase